MQIKYCCTHWGSEKDKPEVFVDKVLSAEYEGIEINFPSINDSSANLFLKLIANIRNTHSDFTFVAQHIIPVENTSVDEYIVSVTKNLLELSSIQPSFINAHT